MLLRGGDDRHDFVHVCLLRRHLRHLPARLANLLDQLRDRRIRARLRFTQQFHVDGELRLLFDDEIYLPLAFFVRHLNPVMLSRCFTGCAAVFTFGSLPIFGDSKLFKSFSVMRHTGLRGCD
jgi:hypothetical protein